jgi:uncharacterized protein YdaU (DUF1376 family)
LTDYPWFKFDVAKERALMDTLTDEQYGAHLRLRIHAWTTNGIPTIDDELRAIGRWRLAQWQRIWPAIARYWRRDFDDPSRLVNDALEAERLDVASRSESGRKAVAKRWENARNTTVIRPNYQERTVQNKTEQDKREESAPLSLATVSQGVYELHPAQIRASASGLYAAWNNVAATVPQLKGFAQDPPFGAPVHRALSARPSIDWWADVFAAVAASDYLRGLVPGRDGTAFGPVTFWWVLDNAEKIAAGQFTNRQRVSRNASALAEVLKDLA